MEHIFPKWETGGEGTRVLLIRVLSGKNSRLTEVPFWNCPEGTFHFMGPEAYRRLLLKLRMYFLLPDCEISCEFIEIY